MPTVYEEAILRTILYADVFDFPLTLDEIHHFLIAAEPASLERLQQTLAESTYLQARLCLDLPYYALNDHPEVIARRQQRESIARDVVPKAQRYGHLLAALPFVRMVAITGAIAVRNPSGWRDDFDYLIITVPGRVWLTRALAVMMVRVCRRFGVELCPNFVLASDQLTQRRQDLFIAREIAQMIPLNNIDLYHAFREANRWTDEYQPNAGAPFYNNNIPLTLTASPLKQALEWVFSGGVGDWLEAWEYQRKRRRFVPQAEQPGASAQIDTGNAKGHFKDHGARVLAAYAERCARYGLPSSLGAQLVAPLQYE
ncbi:MAG: hypothetical protein ACOYL5_05555 [Phototrophicaceae bacterium]